MNHSTLFLTLIRQRADDIDRRAQMLGPLLAGLADEPAPAAPEPLTVRLGRAADWPALSLVAELDSASLPAAPLLVGERDGRLIAALSLSDGAVVANPFLQTADVVALLELRARQISREARRRPGRAIAWRLSRAGS
ncbi:MAG TPA: hypothetical protein VFC22_00660 [Solirubrobacteraceae bacterium]|nr:hypothetical protein [Solirubrobacteraceae bacterium]